MNDAIMAAAKEKRFTAESLLQEIEPLLSSYFIGNFTEKGECILFEFKNGQTFIMKAIEVK